MPAPNPNISYLYKNLSDAGVKVGSIDQFAGKVTDPSMRFYLWKNLSSAGLNTGSFDDFSSKMGFTPQNMMVDKLQQSSNVAASRSIKTISDNIDKDKITFGDNLKYIWNDIVDGASSVVKGASSVGAAVTGSQLSALSYLSKKPESKKEAESRNQNIINELQEKASDGWDKISDFIKSSHADSINHKINNSHSMLEGAVRFIGGVGNFIPQLAVASAAPEAALPAFFVSGYQDGLDRMKKENVSANIKQSYALVNGGINAAIMSIPVGKYLGKIGDRIANKLSADYLSGIIDKYGTDALGEDAVKEAMDNGKRAFYNHIKRAGVQGLKTLAESSVYTFGGAIGDLANKALVNSESGKQVFNIKKEIPNAFKQAAINAVAFGGLAAARGLIFKSTLENIKSSVAKMDPANKEQGLADIYYQIDNAQKEDKLTDVQASYLKNAASVYSKYNESVPKDISADAKLKIFDIMSDQENALNHLSDLNKEMGKSDPSFKEDYENKIKATQSVLQGLHDKIKEVSRGSKYIYFERDGNFYKQMEGDKEIPINQDFYDLQTIGQNFSSEAERPYAEGFEGGETKKPKMNPLLGIDVSNINRQRSYQMLYDQSMENLPKKLRPFVVDQYEKNGINYSAVSITGDEALKISNEYSSLRAKSLLSKKTKGSESLDFPIPLDNNYGGFKNEKTASEKLPFDYVTENFNNEEAPATPEKQENTDLNAVSEDKSPENASQQPSITIKPDEQDVYLKGISERTSSLQERMNEYNAKGDKKNAQRLNNDIDLANKYKELVNKIKVRGEDFIAEMRDNGYLEINCKGKK